MAVHETSIFIRRGINEVLKDFAPDYPTHKLESDGEIAYLFGGETAADAHFGFHADPHVPGWTELVHAHPADHDAIAATLRMFDVDPAAIEVSTTWSGVPLVDVSQIKSKLGRGPNKSTRQAMRQSREVVSRHL